MSDGELRAGQLAPDFTLTSAMGKPVSLSDYRGRKVVVVYFYPKDDTYGCTIEACTFRDQYEAFREAGAEVIGISRDPVDSHAKFASRFGLPFVLLSDPSGQVWGSYGVAEGKVLGVPLMPGRETFVIDKKGVIRHRFASRVKFVDHVETALAVVKRLSVEDEDNSAHPAG